MKLRELAAGCAVLLGIDDGFLREGGVMTEDEQLVYERLKSAIYSVYNFISKDYCRPLYTETVTTDNKSGVLINELTKSFMQLHSAKNEKGCPVAGREYPDYVRFSVRPGSQVSVTYYYLPSRLEDLDDEVELPEKDVAAEAYLYGALSLYYTTEGRHTEAAAWDRRYKSVLDGTERMRGEHRLPSRRWY